MSTTAIVLAAGKNTRLQGIVPAYMKPLILVNGRPLIRTIVHDAYATEGVEKIVVVVAPQNAAQVIEVLNGVMPLDKLSFVVQPSATGPADAVRRGFECADTDNTMIVCGDNVIPSNVYREALYTFGGSLWTTLSATVVWNEGEAERFTRITENELIEHREGGQQADGHYDCWIGPVVVGSKRLRSAFRSASARVELISAVLNQCGPFDVVYGNCQDIGVPESLPNSHREEK